MKKQCAMYSVGILIHRYPRFGMFKKLEKCSKIHHQHDYHYGTIPARKLLAMTKQSGRIAALNGKCDISMSLILQC